MCSSMLHTSCCTWGFLYKENFNHLLRQQRYTLDSAASQTGGQCFQSQPSAGLSPATLTKCPEHLNRCMGFCSTVHSLAHVDHIQQDNPCTEAYFPWMDWDNYVLDHNFEILHHHSAYTNYSIRKPSILELFY